MIKSKFVSLLAMLVAGMMIGNSFIVMASTPIEQPSPNAIIVWAGNHDVSTTETFTDDVIYVTGNVTILNGGTLSLTNTTLQINCTYDGQFHIEVQSGGTLILQDGGDGFDANDPSDTDASVIQTGGTQMFFWARAGSTVTVTNSIVTSVGIVGNGYLMGGAAPETVLATWQAVTNGTFRVTIDGVTRNIWGCDFSTIDGAPSVGADVASIVQARMVTLGFAFTTCVWTGVNFWVNSPNWVDGVFVRSSSVSKFSTSTVAGGTDISGAGGAFLAMAATAIPVQVDSSRTGVYFQTPNVNIVGSQIPSNGNGLFFDCVFPASLAGTNITGSDMYGVAVANVTSQAWACNGVLSGFNVLNANEHGIFAYARTINIEVANVNISGNGYGFTALARTLATANVHDSFFWENSKDPDSGGAYGASIYVLANYWPSTSTAIIENNEIVNNNAGCAWVGYEYEATRSNTTNVQFNNNYVAGNYESNVFHAWDSLYVHAEGNYFGGDGNTGYADGLNIGTGKGSECLDNDQWTENVTFEVIDNMFIYPTDNTYVEVGGVLRTGALWSMHATVTGNLVRGGYTAYGGIFLLGAPTGAFGGLDENARVRYLDALVADNTVELFYTGSGPSVGGVFIFNAMENINMQLLDNTVRSYVGGTGGLVEIQGAVDEDAGFYFPVKNVTALIQGNDFYIDPEDGSNAGGFIRVRAILNVDLTIIENRFTYSDAGGNGYTGGVIRIGTYMWEYMPAQKNLVAVISDNIIDLYNEYSNDVGGIIRITPYENMDVTITGNTISATMNGALIGGVFWLGMQGSSFETDPTPSMCQNMTADVSYNTITIHSYETGGYSLELGGILRVYAFNRIDVSFNHNKISIDIFHYSSSDGVAGMIWIGKHGETHTAKTLTFEMKYNDISVSLTQAEFNGLCRLFAYERIDATIENNNIKVSLQDDSSYSIGGFFTIGDWGNESAHSNTTDFIDSYNRFDLETYVNFNNNNVQAWFPYWWDNTGGIMRVIGRERTEVYMANNVMKANHMPAPSDQADEDDASDFGIRIGKHGFCTDDLSCLISNHTTVVMSNNVIGPGGKGAALWIAGRNSLDVTIEDSTIQGALYCDNEYQTQYGHGVALYSPTRMTATFTNVQFLNNRGAGLYAMTPGTGTVNVYDSRFIGNDWGGIRMNGFRGGVITGTIANCSVYGSEDEFDRYVESTDGMHFEGSTFLVLNSTLDNPMADNEFNVTANSHITARNTMFDKESVSVEATAAYLLSGKNAEVPDFHWNWWNDNYWTAITNGAFNITIDGFAANVGPISFAGVTLPSNVAARIQTAIRAVPGAPDGFLNATVTFDYNAQYNSELRSIIIKSGTKGAGSSISPLRKYNGASPFTDISGETVSSPGAYICGPGRDTTASNWWAVTDGTFRVTIDGYSANVGPINFTGVGSYNDVAARIQTAIRAVAGAPAGFTNAVCRVGYTWTYSNYWSYVILSGTTGQTSSVSPLTPHSLGTGTDISGAEVNQYGYWWMDGAASWGHVLPANSWLDMSDNATVYAQTSSDLLVQWFLDVSTVRLDNGLGIPGASVTVRNLSNAIVATGTTGADGHARDLITSEYLQTPTTKTFYTPHTVTAAKGNATGSAAPAPVMDVSKSVVIVLNYVPPAPTANAGADVGILQGFDVTFNGSGTGEAELTYSWTFNNGTANITLTGNPAAFNVSSLTPGTYTITLTVTDFWGQAANDTLVLTVIDPNPPVADAGPDQTVNEDAVCTFDGTGSADVANYTWTFTNVGAVVLYGVAPTYTFAQPGIYLVTLTVTDIDDNTDIDTVTITVLDVTAPVANAGADISIPEGGVAHFTGTASTDNVGVVSYRWTFTDGGNLITLNGVTANYTFKTAGVYDVTLTAYDAAGNSDTDNVLVTVNDATAPEVLVIAPGESLTGVPLDWSLIIVFTESMNQTSVQEAFSMTGFNGTMTFTWDATGTYVQVTFQGGLAYGTEYTFTIGMNATDLNGNQLAAAKTSSFTTLAEPEVPEEPEEPETNFFTNNWWILVVIIVVLIVLLLVSLLKKKGGAAPVPAGGEVPPAPPEEPAAEPAPAEPAPEAPAAEEEIQ